MKNHNGVEDTMKGYEISEGAVFQASSPSFPGCTRITEIQVGTVQVTVLKNLAGVVSHRVFVTYHITESLVEGTETLWVNEADVERRPIEAVQAFLTGTADFKQVR